MESMTIRSVYGEEKKIIGMLDRLLSRQLFLEADCLDVKTAVSEACLNAIEHGNRLDPQRIVEVTVALHNDTLVVTVADQGTGFTHFPLQNELDQSDWNEASQERGWGLLFVQSLVDEWTLYCRTDTRQFVAQMRKKLNKREGLGLEWKRN